ncbi:hypothetical protein GIB67_000496 [Kingdonia uniflora]|uniref:Uncharacterized protein n=1 Tax=Kingdonia uniflora TaxID=39325 RepID=A0A7J7L0K5_9MAGN|nr:hypothetical protein GIB67_000496 [Kingdonia uniflora]
MKILHPRSLKIFYIKDICKSFYEERSLHNLRELYAKIFGFFYKKFSLFIYAQSKITREVHPMDTNALTHSKVRLTTLLFEYAICLF